MGLSGYLECSRWAEVGREAILTRSVRLAEERLLISGAYRYMSVPPKREQKQLPTRVPFGVIPLIAKDSTWQSIASTATTKT